jgi:FKBP-type peptidyl-prolyl cis-trans isomerase SlyD
MKVSKNKVVSIHYTLKNSEGQILDSSSGREPLYYIQGIGNLIPGLENELENKQVGDKLQAVITPEHAYGERHDSLVQQVSKSGFQGDEELSIGMQVQIETNQGVNIAVVTEISGENVTLDLNHPLAGETLHFDVEVMSLRDASKEELDHGHVHGPGGHHH